MVSQDRYSPKQVLPQTGTPPKQVLPQTGTPPNRYSPKQVLPQYEAICGALGRTEHDGSLFRHDVIRQIPSEIAWLVGLEF